MSKCNEPAAAPVAQTILADDTADASAPPAAETILSIDNVARMFNVSRFTLRYYELRGLIKRRHRIGPLPVYGWADCDRLVFIIKCRRIGLPLNEIAHIVAAVDHEDDIEIHKRGQETCMRLVTHLEERRRILDEALAELAHTYSLLSIKILGPHNFRNHE